MDAVDAPLYRWFAGATMNTCFNALDRHVDSGRTASIHDSPVTGTRTSFTYRELRDEVAVCAGALAGLGVRKGDRVIIYMPMTPRAVVAMLACARLGAVHSVVFGGFAPKELASRIEDAKPKLVVAASAGMEPTRTVAYKPIIDEALAMTEHQPDHVVITQRPQSPADMGPRDVDGEPSWPLRHRTTAYRWPRQIRCTSFTHQVPRGDPRAWSGTTAGTRSR